MAYGLMKDATIVGYSIESAENVDPLAGGATSNDRVRWPGLVLNVGTFSEDYLHQEYHPLGSGHRLPHIVKTKGENFEIEIQSLWDASFVQLTHLFRLAFGTVAADGIVTPATPLETLTLEFGWDDGSTPFFYLLTGCKVDQLSFAFRPDDMVLVTTKLIGRTFTANTAEIGTSGGTSLSELVQSTSPCVHFEDTTWTWEDGSGASLTLDPIITEFDLTISNTITRIHSDNQQLYASHLIEGKQSVTWSITSVRQSSELYDIFRADPVVAAGQVHLKVVVDKTSGPYMSLDMGVDTAGIYCVMAEHELPQSQDQDFLEQSFAGMLVGGDPVIDFQV